MSDLSEQIDAIAVAALDGGLLLAQFCELVEAHVVDAATKRTKGNITAAAQLLGIHRNTLHNKLRSRSSELLSGMQREHRSLLRQAAKLQKTISERGPARGRRR